MSTPCPLLNDMSLQLPAKLEALKMLGSGGMAHVLLANDTQLQRQVAVKLLKPCTRLSEEDVLTEARIMARLNHANIVQIYELHKTQQGLALIMEYVAGQPLNVITQSRLLTLEEKLQIATDICKGLAYAHQQGVLHCDLKPGNILLSHVNDVKVTDFGISQLLHDDSVASPIYGTHSAMSPEHLLGLPLSEKSDLFSLGLLMFELFAGRHPFGSHQADATKAILTATPSSARDIFPLLPTALAELIDMLLLSDPAQRPNSAQYVYERLCDIKAQHALLNTDDTVLLDDLTSSPQAPDNTHTSPEKGRSRGRIWPAMAVLTFSIVISLIYWQQMQPVTRYIAVMEPDFTNSELNAQQQQLLRATVNDALSSAIAQSSALYLIPSSEYKGVHSSAHIADITGATDIVQSQLDCTSTTCLLKLSHIDTSNNTVLSSQSILTDSESYLKLKDSAHVLLTDLFPDADVPAQLTQNIGQDAYLVYLSVYINAMINGHYNPEDLTRLTPLIDQNPRFYPLYSLFTFLAIKLSETYGDKSHLQPLQQALHDAPHVYQYSNNYHINMALLSIETGDIDKADSHIGAISLSGAGPVFTLMLQGQKHFKTGNISQAIESYKAMLKLKGSVDDHYNLAIAHYYNADLEQAKTLLYAVIDRAGGTEYIYKLLGDIYLSQGQPDKFLANYNKLTTSDPLSENNKAIAYMLLSQPTKALSHAKAAYRQAPQSTLTELTLADNYLLLGDHHKAHSHYHAILAKTHEQSDFESQIDRAQAAAQLGEAELALTALNQAIKLSNERYEYAYTAATVYTLVGEYSSANIHVKDALNAGYHAIWFSYPWFKPLCRFEHFKDIVTQRDNNPLCRAG
ncbi:serine/threonine-protein kinase [Pseudoalteromonas rubra]|uniref:non-specific serine/threonine protein kinase n=1 Tax=Pseudoalteromonas rubra TaxID=43658 RepID=A0A0F4QDZ1_9GAMM|nr:serine/threonine-protein kinase [Pseudoalteromonas rubra]KJZ05500.1 hypothetical protein TW77_22615 [Pseudoalteromonas rubra]